MALTKKRKFYNKANDLKIRIQKFLWDSREQFYKVIPQSNKDEEIINITFDKIPAEHEKFTVTYGGYDFMVQDVHDNVIQAVCVKKHDS
mgnify:CR=1 FL=1